MNYLKQFLQTKECRRFLWTFLNVLMGFVVSFIAFLATQNIDCAIVVLPFATAFSQMLTKFLNTPN